MDSHHNLVIKLKFLKTGVVLTRRDEYGRLWVVHAPQFRETWTEQDVEVLDRKELPISSRSRIWNKRFP